MDKYKALKHYFGYDSFRPGQEKIIDTVLSGRDVLAVMPTGAGKSLCFQIPALLIPGITLVISPLISLMKDQINALNENGIKAVALNSSHTPEKTADIYRKAVKGAYKIIYVAPERLETSRFLSLVNEIDISLVCVDEAHCVSQWGQDFRSSYLTIDRFISSLRKRPTVAAFTATATKQVRDDICRLLALKEPEITVTGYDRQNLHFEVRKTDDKFPVLRECLSARPDRSAIVYCATRKLVNDVWESLNAEGFKAVRYHAGLPGEMRKYNQELFINDDVKIMVATNAFGMGIDKSNVGLVVHYNMPGDIESYYQEAGRAGRDGEQADCILIFSPKDIIIQRYFINNTAKNDEMSFSEKEKMRQRRLDMLDSMIYYCRSRVCLRQFLLGYFGEAYDKKCNNCSVCCGIKTYSDITVTAQKLLSGIARTGQRLTEKELFDFITGQPVSSELSEIKTYGILRQMNPVVFKRLSDFLISEGYVRPADGALRLTSEARKVLFEGKRVYLPVIRRNDTESASDLQNTVKGTGTVFDMALLSLLKNMRKKVAMKASIPPFAVFSDATLREMAEKKPVTKTELLRITGISMKKCERYGEYFTRAIKIYITENSYRTMKK